jgi:hypothetical protein
MTSGSSVAKNMLATICGIWYALLTPRNRGRKKILQHYPQFEVEATRVETPPRRAGVRDKAVFQASVAIRIILLLFDHEVACVNSSSVSSGMYDLK